MNVRVGRVSTLVAVSTAVLVVCSVPVVAAAPGASALAAGSPSTIWAYGGVRNVTFSGESAVKGWAYQGSATYGYTVVLQQTNLTPDTFELSANRTMGASLMIRYCTPNCKSPTATVSLGYRAWESTDDWANFTTAGTVFENGAPTTAIALNNSHSTLVGSLNDTARWPAHSDLLQIGVSSSASVQFTPALGLIPESLAPGASWNATSGFSATGSFLLSYYYHHVGPLDGNLTFGPGTLSGNVGGSGNVSVIGSAGPGHVSFGGAAYDDLSLEVLGPFSVREGFILVPAEVDLFGGSSESPLQNASGASTAEMTSIYARPSVGGHLGIVGSEWTFVSSALNPGVAAVLPPTGAGAGVAQLASGSDNVGTTSVQGVPMSVPAAQGVRGCLVTGGGCPSSGTVGAFLDSVVIIGGVLVAAVVASLVIVTERRRVPPPPRPYAGLYPPVVTLPGAAAGGGQNPPPPPPPEDDPLSHLW